MTLTTLITDDLSKYVLFFLNRLFFLVNFRICNARFDVVCGSDGVTYSNPCNLNAVACHTGSDIKIVSKGKCLPCLEAVEAEPEDGRFI